MSWDGVWDGAATIDSLGWVAEFRVPFSPVTPMLGILMCLWLMKGLPRVTWERFGLWLVAGLPSGAGGRAQRDLGES